MSFPRKNARRTARAYARILDGGAKTTGPDGQPLHVLGSSQEEALASLRAMPIPPSRPGEADSDRDDINPVEYRREINARKRARRARRGK